MGVGGDVAHDGLATPCLVLQAEIRQFATNPLRLRIGLVTLVDRHYDRHLGSLGVVDGLDCLGFHAVIGRYHQHHHIGNLRAAGTHLGEGFVARCIQKDHAAGGHFTS